MFPWVLASQVLSLALTIFVFRFIDGFGAAGDVTCVATFIPIVAAPPATMLLYGPSVPALLTSRRRLQRHRYGTHGLCHLYRAA